VAAAVPPGDRERDFSSFIIGDGVTTASFAATIK
jgi:hypothetical protein